MATRQAAKQAAAVRQSRRELWLLGKLRRELRRRGKLRRELWQRNARCSESCDAAGKRQLTVLGAALL